MFEDTGWSAKFRSTHFTHLPTKGQAIGLAERQAEALQNYRSKPPKKDRKGEQVITILVGCYFSIFLGAAKKQVKVDVSQQSNTKLHRNSPHRSCGWFQSASI
jgi:hypothetical protein